MKRCPFHTWHELHQACVADIQNQPVDDLVAKVAVSHLAAFEPQGCLNLVALSKKANGLVLFGLIVVLVHRNRELYFFDDDDFLLLPRGAVALVLLVQEFAVVLNLADRRNGVRGDLYEIQRALAGHLEGVERGHDAKLFTVLVDDADLARTDAFIGTDERLGGTFINWWNGSPPQRAFKLAMRCIGFGAAGEKRLCCNVKYNTLFTRTIDLQANSKGQRVRRSSAERCILSAQDFAIASVL